MDIIIDIIESYGVLIIFILMFTNGFISIPPSELVIAYSGVLVSQGAHRLLFVVIAIYFGNLLGAVVLYYVGKNKKHFFLKYFSGNAYNTKLVTLLLPDENSIIAFTRFIEKEGVVWVGVFRCFPMIRSIISIPAGMANVSLLDFVVYSSLGILLWMSFWLLVGYAIYEVYTQYHILFTVAFLFVLLIAFVICARQALGMGK